jgi:PKD repeat protein
VTGSLALLIQHYSNLNGASRKMRASTLKALAIHSADEAGDHDGPDYEFGWGLMNTKKAALKISQSDTLDVILEKVLENGQTYKKYFTALSDDSLRVTLVWTDPPGKMPENLEVDPDDPALVNDLDLVVIDTTDHISYYPWTLDKENPSDSAVKAVNNVDNVEQVDIHYVETGHVYAVMVTHKNVLRNDRQLFSLVISAPYQNVGKPVPDFFASSLSCAVGQTVYLFDASEKKVQSRAWNITPSTYEFKNGTGASSENPVIVFNDPGQYQVALTVTNATGDSTLTRAAYITVGADPSGYCEAYSMNSWGHVKKVQFCNLIKESAATNVGDDDPNDKYYQDWTGNSTKVVRGQTRELFIENSVTDPVYTPYLDVFVWIDWNRDGDFFDEGELVVSDVDNGGGGSFYVKIPLEASLGRTRMRIRSHYKNDYGANSCGYTDYGEVEDYTLEIVDPEPIVWTGSVSSDWADENNWDLGKVPDFLNDVTVPASPSGGRFPVVNAGDTLGTNSVTIENGSQLQVNGQLSIYH